MRMLSVIVPCYNEEESVADFYQELMKNDAFFKEKELEVEVLFIDDGSRDNTAATACTRWTLTGCWSII